MGYSYLVGLWRNCYVEPEPELEVRWAPAVETW